MRTILWLSCVFCIAFPSLAADGLEPKKTFGLLVGVLRWKDAGITSYSSQDRKDRKLFESLVALGVPKENYSHRPVHWYPRKEITRLAPPVRLSSEESRKKATAGGKYSQLLRRIEVESDWSAYGNFRDYGAWSGTEWNGHTDLPPGYWVYVYPHWYIWRDVAATGR